jgi:D-aminopeptidase
LEDLVIAGVPVGRELADLEPIEKPPQDGSIIIVIGTDAPLSGSQLNLVAKRAALGMARTGTTGERGPAISFSLSRRSGRRMTPLPGR